MQLNVPFSEIPEHGIEYEIKDTTWFPDELVGQAGSAAIHIRLTKKNDNSVEVKGSLQASVFLECDRCLKQYTFQIDSPMQLVVTVSEKEEHWKIQDIEATEAELETLVLDKPVVELPEIFRQQVLLALPEKRLCMASCSGLCSKCGANLNEEQCDCSKQSANSPFAVLGSLKK